ncbi:hypothetical protein BC827DRAFT_1194963 [Russula dissimulans]|nr:hypothetical protein BC827DRAFT_1194963 [Russula dissimulans]
MRHFALTLTLTASIQTAFSFLETSPVLLWSSHRSDALDRLRPAFVSNSPTPPSNEVFSKLLFSDVCEFDAIIMVDQPGLHASDLRSLSPSSFLATRLQDSPSSIQLPYVRLPLPHEADPSPLQELAEKVSVFCNAQHLSFHVSDADTDLPFEAIDFSPGHGPKRVLRLLMPAVTESAGARKRSVADHEARLATELDKLARAYPRHLVILAGSPRQDAPPSPSPPAGGILTRYQLLTPVLITGLLVVFFVLVPVILFGISALASIQSPLRVQPPKGFSADEKKNQ